MNNKKLFLTLILLNLILFILLMTSVIMLLFNWRINKKLNYSIIMYLGVAFLTALVFLIDFLKKSKFNKIDLIKFDLDKIQKSKKKLEFPIIINLYKSLNNISYVYLLFILIIIISFIINKTVYNKSTELSLIILFILLLIPARGVLKDEGYIFLSVKGKPFNRETLNKCVIFEIMKNVDIKKHVSCYTFRHSVATHLVKNHVDIRYIAQLLGHESLRTTQKYVHLEISDFKKMHSLYHPREQDKN
jgi:integrase